MPKVRHWRFAIDVGGTFTDVLGYDPGGREHVLKVLSNGRIRGVTRAESSDTVHRARILHPPRDAQTADAWTGYSLRDVEGRYPAIGVAGNSADGLLRLTNPLPGSVDTEYELFSAEPAPLVAIRLLMGLRLDQPIGPIDVRLGSTRGTNALLERAGCSTVFVTTEGFADLLRIGYQDRPHLFELDIRKNEPIHDHVVEIPERVSATGEVLRPVDTHEVERRLRAARDAGCTAAAVCLMHACINDEPERLVGQIAREIGFDHISLSSTTAPTPRMVPRGDTTLVDAYLSGVIRDYIAELHRCMPEARLRMMTSAGGLVDGAAFAPKDSVLSGPAGGVVGCAAAADTAGFDRAIGFDMGGTSTDVCRYDGTFEHQYETEKAGVRLVTPMLAVETVAAGGGSICAFDGQKLTVGPQSAGADPGPACYGRGGPLALTDINLFLGRVLEDRFPFALNRPVVETRLDVLAREVATATGQPMNAAELAEGFRSIADEHMASAIKTVSVQRGYEVNRYALIAYGGAAGQHACSVARLLGIRRILIGPHAGILSAVGLSRAHVVRHHERPVLHRYDDSGLAAATILLDDMEVRLHQQIRDEGIAESNIEPARRRLDLRYEGQDATVTVEGDSAGRFDRPFEAAHLRLYGYLHTGRTIEIVAARVEMTGRTDVPDPPARSLRRRRAAADEHRTLLIDGVGHDTLVYHRDRLDAGDQFTGPAIVVDSFGTIIVDPGFSAEVTRHLDLVLVDTTTDPTVTPGATDRTDVDPVRLEIFHNRFASMAEQMGATLRRTAMSVNVKERLDFSCAVFDGDGALVANAPHIPVHLGGMSDCIRGINETLGPLAPGDVVITNDPYAGGSHLPDVTVVTPVHIGSDSTPRFFVASRAHHAEIGGITPGSMAPDARILADEGVLIEPFKLFEKGREHIRELESLLTGGAYPSRRPQENLADLHAQVAANRRGVELLTEMAGEHGADVVAVYMDHIRHAAAARMGQCLRGLIPGRHQRGEELDDGTPIAVTIDIEDGRATIDFTDSGPVHAGNLNANPSIVRSAVLYCLRCILAEDIPLNDGVLEPIRLIVPVGILNPPPAPDRSHSPAVGGGNVETSQRIVDAVFGALGVVAASQGTMNNLLIGDETFGYYETIAGGAGAGPGFDGADAVQTHMTNTRLTDPEVLETRYPLRLVRFEIRRGSGGAGRHRGGDGVIREIEFLERLDVSILSQRRTTAPYGLAGGSDGSRGRNVLRRRQGTLDPVFAEEELPGIVRLTVRAGDRLIVETPGGGGYGPLPIAD